MALELRVIGDELFLAGTPVAHIYSSVPATVAQDLRDTLDGIELDTQYADGTLQQVEESAGQVEQLESRRKRFLVWARKRFKDHRKSLNDLFRYYSAATNERDDARRWAEKTVAEVTAQRDHAYELGKEHQRRDMQAELQHWKEQAATWEGHARSLWAQTNGGR